MSSAIPYDPDEFDNNPFAEPSVPSVGADSDVQRETGHESHQEQVVDKQDNEVNEDKKDDKKDEAKRQGQPTLLPERGEDAAHLKLSIKVQALERSGSLSNKKENPAVIFDVTTNIQHFRKKKYKGIKKSYHEFETFWRFLNGANPECFVPALPLSSTNFGIQNEDDYKKTLSNFQNWFNKVTSNPILLRNEEFGFFIESDFGSYSPINKSKLPATGIKRKTLKQLQPPYDEFLELAEFRPLVKSIYKDSTSILEKLEKLTKLKKQLGVFENEMGNKITELNELEQTHPGMANMWRKFGKTVTILGDLDSIIASLDMATLGDGLQDVINNGYIIKEALTNRHLLMRDLVLAQQNTKIKHENARKLRNKRDINPIKVDEAIRSLEEATSHEEALTQKIKRITEEMLIEKQEYLERFDELIQSIFKEFVIRKIEQERRKLSILEKVRINVRMVDSNGGLSRLGREQYPVKKGSSIIQSSQSLHGDSWSGDRKTSHFNADILRDDVDVDDDDDNIGGPDDKLGDKEQEEDETPINAKDAASILGGSTFL